MAYDVLIVGSGFGALTAAALLTKRGLKVGVLEQNKYAGGCSTTYKRKGYWFETGATTLVGLDEHMPLRYLIDETGINVNLRKLELPMQVHPPDGQVINRYPDLEDWISEAERVFGKKNQRTFWKHLYSISQQVWQTSLTQLSFPISNYKDLWQSILRARPSQLRLIPGAFRTMEDVLRKYDLLQNKLFVEFVNEQLLITAQNYLPEVNELFGATALCYTLYGNFYVDGGLINLINPITDYITSNGSSILYRHKVDAIIPLPEKGYKIHTSKGILTSRFVISGVPLNNTASLIKDEKVQESLRKYILPSPKLNSAFSISMVLKNTPALKTIHHQVHVPEGLPIIKSKSIFLSLSHPEDTLRAAKGETIASVSTHIQDPENNYIEHKAIAEDAIIKVLQERGLVRKENILYLQSATPGSWLQWTGRAYGMVGGYPQYQHLKLWQMKDARLDHKGAYLCGDTVYPGQGIPGTCLSGIIAAHKLLQDHY
ncbi:phytoene desaturase family protein [Pontibacter vulgaris]|uniref:phytoene desaturase family protein n=1 Tax=Pontibacter vulgaris TaxID=2905679 RepID=UPI001FA71811|nr:NAD(P)/FAD-dependent oxidoreductase [Pontibacter vulgaris]